MSCQKANTHRHTVFILSFSFFVLDKRVTEQSIIHVCKNNQSGFFHFTVIEGKLNQYGRKVLWGQ